MTRGINIYAKAYDMEMSKISAYPQSDHVLPQIKCVLQYCAKFPRTNIPDQETDDQYSNKKSFHLFSHLSYNCTLYRTWHVSVN